MKSLSDGIWTVSGVESLADRYPLSSGPLRDNPAVMELARLVNGAPGDDIDALSRFCREVDAAAGGFPVMSREAKLRGIVLRAIGLKLPWPDNFHGWTGSNDMAGRLVRAAAAIEDDDLDLVDEVLALRGLVPIASTFLDVGLIAGNRISRTAVLEAVKRSRLDQCLVLAAGCRSLDEDDARDLLGEVERGEWIVDYIEGQFGTSELSWADWGVPFRLACELQDGPSEVFWTVTLDGLSEGSSHPLPDHLLEELLEDFDDFDVSWIAGVLADRPDQMALALNSRWTPAVVAGASATRDVDVLRRLAVDSRSAVRRAVAANPAATDEVRADCSLGE